MPRAIEIVRQYGLKLVGIHMHIGSGVDYGHLSQVCDAMVDLVTSLGHDVDAISAGGGLSIPYRDGEPRVDVGHYFSQWDAARKRIERHLGHPVRIEIEPGRFLVAEAGTLVTEVQAVNRRPKHDFVLIDAGFNDLMRPSMYGSYHAVSVHTHEGALPAGRPLVDLAIAGRCANRATCSRRTRAAWSRTASWRSRRSATCCSCMMQARMARRCHRTTTAGRSHRKCSSIAARRG